jgi:hypothetical protein
MMSPSLRAFQALADLLCYICVCVAAQRRSAVAVIGSNRAVTEIIVRSQGHGTG